MIGNQQYAATFASIKSHKQKQQGVIYIEDITDKKFWEKIATQHFVQLYSEQGRAITGKSKLLEICSKNNLIAIDSDFDLICPNHRRESIIFSEKKAFILQTYTHGLENLIFSPECLHEILNENFKLYLENHNNNIQEIIQNLAEIWFEPYRKFLFLLNNQHTNFNYDYWITNIKFKNKECQEIVLDLNFSTYQERLEELNQHLKQNIGDEKYHLFCNWLSEHYFDRQQVYAFIRCHDWAESFVLPIVRMIISNRIKKEIDHVNENFQGNELIYRKNQINNYFKDNCNIKTVLHSYFYHAYLPNACSNGTDFFLLEIIKDYEQMLKLV